MADPYGGQVTPADPWGLDPAPDERYAPVATLGDPAVVAALAARVGARLGDPPLRAALSAVVMGVSSRLWSVTVVPVVRTGVLPDPAALVVRDEAGTVVLGHPGGPGTPGAGPDEVAAAVHQVLDPLVAAVLAVADERSGGLSARVLHGDVAAGLHAVPRVHRLQSAWPLVRDLLSRPPWAGELDGVGTARARRRTCCLFHLVRGPDGRSAGICGDCVLDRVPAPAG